MKSVTSQSEIHPGPLPRSGTAGSWSFDCDAVPSRPFAAPRCRPPRHRDFAHCRDLGGLAVDEPQAGIVAGPADAVAHPNQKRRFRSIIPADHRLPEKWGFSTDTFWEKSTDTYNCPSLPSSMTVRALRSTILSRSRAWTVEASETSSTTSALFANAARISFCPFFVMRPSATPLYRARKRCRVSLPIPASELAGKIVLTERLEHTLARRAHRRRRGRCPRRAPHVYALDPFDGAYSNLFERPFRFKVNGKYDVSEYCSPKFCAFLTLFW